MMSVSFFSPNTSSLLCFFKVYFSILNSRKAVTSCCFLNLVSWKKRGASFKRGVSLPGKINYIGPLPAVGMIQWLQHGSLNLGLELETLGFTHRCSKQEMGDSPSYQ